MSTPRPPFGLPLPEFLEIEVTEEELADYTRRADAEGLPVEQWMKNLMNARVDEMLGPKPPRPKPGFRR